MILCKTKSLWKVYETNAFYMRYTFEKEFGYGKGEGNGEDEIIFNFFWLIWNNIQHIDCHSIMGSYNAVYYCNLSLF